MTVRRQGQDEGGGGAAIALREGDYVLESATFVAVVGGMGREGVARGAVLEASLRGAPLEDSIVRLQPLVSVGERELALTISDMEILLRDGRPVVRMVGGARDGLVLFDVVREIGISRFDRALTINTSVSARLQAPSAPVSIGSRIAWGGASPFVPGLGLLADEAWHETHWLGYEGERSGTAFGATDRPIRARAVFEQHGEAFFLEHTDVVSQDETLATGQLLTDRVVLALSGTGLGSAVRRLGWSRSAHFPELFAELPYRPAGATIEVETLDHRPLILTMVGDASGLLVPITPLFPPTEAPRLRAFASAYGHAPSDAVEVIPGETQRVRLDIPRGGQVRVLAIDRETGESIPVRMRFIGASPDTKPPELGPDWSASGARDTVVALDGEAVVPLQPGSYRVLISHGPEWTMVDQHVQVTETFRPDLRARLTQVIDPGEWVGADFHVHASPSPDSKVTLEDRVASLVAEGVRFAVPTDHNHVTDYGPAIADVGARGFGSVPGVEVTTWEPHFGHFNAYPFPLDPGRVGNGAPAFLRQTPASLFAALHAVDPEIVVQINHPRLEGEIGYFDMAELDPRAGTWGPRYSADYDVLEVWNGFDLARPEATRRVFEDWLFLLARGKRVVGVGNSDSHAVRYQWAGYPRTYVRVPGGDVDDGRAVIRALKAGRAFVTSGPFLEATVEGKGPGETAGVVGGKVRVRIVVRVAPFVDLQRVRVYLDGVEAAVHEVPAVVEARRRRGSGVPAEADAEADGPAPTARRFEVLVELPLQRDAFIIVTAEGDRPLDDFFARAGILPWAFTNPIWIDANGDGRVVLPPFDPHHALPLATPTDTLLDAGGDRTSPRLRDAAMALRDPGRPLVDGGAASR